MMLDMAKKQEPDYRSFANNRGGNTKKQEDELHKAWVAWKAKREVPWYMAKPVPNSDRE